MWNYAFKTFSFLCYFQTSSNNVNLILTLNSCEMAPYHYSELDSPGSVKKLTKRVTLKRTFGETKVD